MWMFQSRTVSLYICFSCYKFCNNNSTYTYSYYFVQVSSSSAGSSTERKLEKTSVSRGDIGLTGTPSVDVQEKYSEFEYTF